MGSPPKYRNGRERKKLAARKVSMAMYSHVTHPNARRDLGRRPPCSSAACPSCLDDTGLRGRPGPGGPPAPEGAEEHGGDARDPARPPPPPAEAARQHEHVRVFGVQRPVV